MKLLKMLAYDFIGDRVTYTESDYSVSDPIRTCSDAYKDYRQCEEYIEEATGAFWQIQGLRDRQRSILYALEDAEVVEMGGTEL